MGDLASLQIYVCLTKAPLLGLQNVTNSHQHENAAIEGGRLLRKVLAYAKAKAFSVQNFGEF